MNRTHAILVILALSLAFVPAASAQDDVSSRKGTDVTFYGHVFSTGLATPMPANTIFPAGEDNLGLGVFHLCTAAGGVTLGGVPSAEQNCDNDPNNKLVLFSTAGPVDIGSRDEYFGGGEEAQFHNERGSTKDIVLDSSKSLTATVYMSLDSHVWSVGQGIDGNGVVFPPTTSYCYHPHPPDSPCVYPYWGWDPAVWPDWVVEATLYYAVFGEHGSGASEALPIQDALADGSAVPVATGRVGPMQVTNGLPGTPNVVRFDVDMGTPEKTTIPKEANFFLVYNFYSEGAPGKYATATWRLWTGEFFPPTFTMPTKNAFDVELVVPVFLHNKLVIVGILNTPWGSYDVDPDATTLTITKDNKEVFPESIEVVNEYKFAHGAHYNPVNVSYIWDFKKDGLTPGTYTVTIAGQNQQGNAKASCTATFEIKPNGEGGNVEVGRCGLVSEQADAAANDGASNAADGGSGRSYDPSTLDLPYGLERELDTQTAVVTPAASTSALVAPLGAFALLAPLGLALRRRWGL